MYTILLYLLLTVHVAVSILMVLVVLMQRPRSEGLGAAFGGGMTDNIFGAQTTNVLAKFTTWLGGAFFALTLLLAILYSQSGNTTETQVQRELMNMPEPPPAAEEPATPAASAEPTPVEPTEPTPASTPSSAADQSDPSDPSDPGPTAAATPAEPVQTPVPTPAASPAAE